MNSYDLSPLFRSTVGYDHVSQMLNNAFKIDERAMSYPPYNIAKLSEDDYEIVMALAGFTLDDLRVVVENNVLTVSGAQQANAEDEGKTYLHRGIATRSFERKFTLADHVKVTDAHLVDGILTLTLVREIPEESKPKQIAIHNGAMLQGRKPKKAA